MIKTKPLKRTLNVNERESIEDQIKQKELLLKAGDDYSEGNLTVVAPKETGLNKTKLQADIKHLKGVLDNGTPELAVGQDRQKLANKKKEMEEFLRENVLETREEINVTNNQHPAWTTAIRKAQQRPKYEKYIAEYKEVCKSLDPDDPSAGSLDAIRKDR